MTQSMAAWQKAVVPLILLEKLLSLIAPELF